MNGALARRIVTICSLILLDGLSSSPSANSQPSALPVRSGAALYRAACLTCHGADGRGTSADQLGFDTPLPDFTACSFATPEPDADWRSIIQQGGPARAFSRRMPAFQELLTADEVASIVGYLRGFCSERSWPLGDLNLPRPLFTEKAFPENESLLTSSVSTGGAAGVGNDFVYEHRIGARSQYEVKVPIDLRQSSGRWERGLGDVAVAFKHALYHDRTQGGILSAGGEVVLPTGAESRGLGAGMTIVEPFVTYGQRLGSDSFLQLHGGMELPTDTQRANKEAFVRGAFGKTYTQGTWGRSWSPMLELLAARELVRDESTRWDLVPQMQVSLSRRKHIMVAGGVRLPLNQRGDRGAQVVTYLLWDWFDGGLFEGWK